MSVKYEQNGHSYNYLFHYDGLNRLTTANSYDKTGNGIPYSELYEYDKMGNITYLERKLGANKTDALNFEYTGNQIKKVSSVSPALGYDFGSMTYPDLSDASIEYYYDNNGNLIKNLDKGVVATRHNFLNLPDTIQFQNGNQIINSYLADGRKVKAVYKTYSTGIVVPQDAVYHGNASYDVSTDEWDSHYMYRSWYGHSPRMFMVQTPEGYVGADYVGIDSHRNYAYYYYVHDHLGNVRITRNSQGYYSDQSLEYYPSGVLFDRSAEKERQPYMFGGKELVSMHGLNEYDFGNRLFATSTFRFTTMDRFCEKYYSLSPYQYAANNPINNIEINGDSIWFSFQRNSDKQLTGVTMHVTGKVINDSQNDIDMDSGIANISSGIRRAFEGEMNENISFKVDVQLSVASTMKDVQDSDHLFVLTDKIVKLNKGEIYGASNDIGGKVAFVNADYFIGTYDELLGSRNYGTFTAVHEFGHLSGLDHVRRNPFNLMRSGGFLYNLNKTQRSLVYLKWKGRKLNKGNNYEIHPFKGKVPNRGNAAIYIKP